MKVPKTSLLLLMLFSLMTAICYGQTAKDCLDKGIAYANKGMYDEAIAEFKKAIEINPNFAMAHSNLGAAYINKGMLDQPIAQCKRALDINPNYADAHYNLAVSYYYKREYSLAIRHCDRFMELGYEADPELLKALKPYRKK